MRQSREASAAPSTGRCPSWSAERPTISPPSLVHVGPAGSGQTVKAANQLMVGGIIELVSEALLLVQIAGVDTERAVTVLAGGLAGNKVLDLKAQNMLAGKFEPGFRIDLHHKDMGIVMETARHLGLPLPLGGVVAQLFVAARAQGLGSLDHSGLMVSLEHLAGRNTDGSSTQRAE
jgi:2-hydroxy-3-oxopropionate reductase